MLWPILFALSEQECICVAGLAHCSLKYYVVRLTFYWTNYSSKCFKAIFDVVRLLMETIFQPSAQCITFVNYCQPYKTKHILKREMQNDFNRFWSNWIFLLCEFLSIQLALLNVQSASHTLSCYYTDNILVSQASIIPILQSGEQGMTG